MRDRFPNCSKGIAIVYADLELEHSSREQYAMDTVAHYNRPDIFSLTVDTRTRPQVSWVVDPAPQQVGSAGGP